MKAILKLGAFVALFLLTGPLCVLALLNWSPIAPVLGTSYDVIATKTLSQYVSQNSAVKQQLWIDGVLDTNGASYQDCPFADAMTGRVTVGKPASHSQLNKAVVEITDTAKIRGDTINIFSLAGIGGEGATGDNTRNGTEAQIFSGNMTVTIGNQLFSVGYKQSAVDKSMIGKPVTEQKWLYDGLKNLHAKRKNDTIIWRMLAAAGYGGATFAGTYTANNIYPDGVANREALRSADTVDLPLIMAAGDYLPGLGARPLDTTQDSGGSVGELFMFMSSDKALVDLESDPTLTQVLQYGWDRGQNNPIFAGGFVKARGHGIYRWIHRDHANYDNIGSPLLPRAKLGVAITGGNTSTDVMGGGLLYTADTAPKWFKHFSNAPVTMYGGIDSISATTSTTRYIRIINNDGTGDAVYSYTTNTGNKITIAARVSGTGSSGASYNHPQGSLIVECNSAGQPFGRSIMFGAQAVVGGKGSINGSPADPENGRLITQKLDMENDISVGVEGCGGYSAVKRAGDGAYPGFVIVEHAVNVPGIART